MECIRQSHESWFKIYCFDCLLVYGSLCIPIPQYVILFNIWRDFLYSLFMEYRVINIFDDIYKNLSE